MSNRYLSRRFLILTVSSLILLSTSAFAQLTEIENKLPKSIPLEVEFKNFDKENWWHDLEIKVTNTGKKPIYYLSLYLWLDVVNSEGKRRAAALTFGDTKRWFSSSNGEVAISSDSAIFPNKSHTFKIGENYTKGWDLSKQLGSFVEPSRAELEHGYTNFGDETGILPGGTPWRKKKSLNMQY